MNPSTLWALSLCVVFLSFSIISAGNASGTRKINFKHDYENLELGKTTDAIVPRASTQNFCFESKEIDLSLPSIISQTTVTVSVTDSNHKFDWFDIGGISTDDFQSHLKRLGYLILSIDSSDIESLISSELDPLVERNFIRDILSSCPSPISSSLGMKSQSCQLTFSPFGKLCINIRGHSSQDRMVRISSETGISKELVVKFVFGLTLLYLANTLSANMLFQYTGGAFLFVVGGFAVMFILICQYLIKRKHTNNNNLNPSLLTTLTLLVTVGGTYATSFIWFLNSRVKNLLILHSEYVAIYTIIMLTCGLIFTRFMRSFQSSKHAFRVCVKWLIRLVALVLLYNATSSPFVSLSILSISFVVYVIYSSLKWVENKISKRKTGKKD